jgi:hypothetical protein
MIVSAVSTDAATHDVLAVIQTSAIETARAHWKTVDGPVLEVQPLPYAVI